MKFNLWVNPVGKIFEVSLYGHHEFAMTQFSREADYSFKDASTRLEESGWVRVLYWQSMDAPKVLNCNNRINELQEKAIIDYGLEFGRSILCEFKELVWV